MATSDKDLQLFLRKIKPLREHAEESVSSGRTVDFGGGNTGSVQSGSVQDSRLNGGKPTLIPFIWDGKKVSAEEAVDRALESGVKWPSFESNEKATQVSKALSSSLGSGRGISNRDLDRINKLSQGSTIDPFVKDIADVKEGNRKAAEQVGRRRSDRDRRREEFDSTKIDAGNKRVDKALRDAEGRDPDIMELTEKVMQAAGGTPLKISITEKQRQERLMKPLMREAFTNILNQDGTQEGAGTPNNGQAGSSENGRATSDKDMVTKEDLAGLQKSIDQLSTNLAVESK